MDAGSVWRRLGDLLRPENGARLIWAYAPALVALVFAFAIARWSVHWALHLTALLLVMAAMGFADAKLVTQWAAAPVAPPNLGGSGLEGWVVDVASPSKGRPRLLIAPTFIAGLAPATTPARVRVTLRTGAAITPGHGVTPGARSSTRRQVLQVPAAMTSPATPGSTGSALWVWRSRRPKRSIPKP